MVRLATVTMLLLIPALAFLQNPSEGPKPEPLRQKAERRRKLVGTAVSARFLDEPDYCAVLGREFNQIEPENEMKFESIHPRPDSDPKPYDFTGADRIVAFAQAHKMRVRGHCLVWHNQVARWVSAGSPTPDDLAKTLRDHIHTVVKRYSRKVYAWDVVNEAFNEDGTLRHSVWNDRPGYGFAGQNNGFIEQAFRWAHEADKHAKLFYNDYSSETVNRKSDAIYAMAQDFKQRGVPIDGIGFQMHLDLRSDNPDTLASIKRNFDRFAALGLEIQVTELDISLPDNNPPTLAKQAKLYREVVDLCLSQRRCSAIQFWGFTDKHSWIPGYTRGKQGWALLFDEQYREKPSYQSVSEAMTIKR